MSNYHHHLLQNSPSTLRHQNVEVRKSLLQNVVITDMHTSSSPFTLAEYFSYYLKVKVIDGGKDGEGERETKRERSFHVQMAATASSGTDQSQKPGATSFIQISQWVTGSPVYEPSTAALPGPLAGSQIKRAANT